MAYVRKATKELLARQREALLAERTRRHAKLVEQVRQVGRQQAAASL